MVKGQQGPSRTTKRPATSIHSSTFSPCSVSFNKTTQTSARDTPRKQQITLVKSRFATIPQELFDEIVSYFPPPLPISYNSNDMFPRPPRLKYAEREVILRSLSQTCKDLRRMAFPLLWKRIDMCWVPEDERGHWYKYVMQELKRKASGVSRAQADLRGRVE